MSFEEQLIILSQYAKNHLGDIFFGTIDLQEISKNDFIEEICDLLIEVCDKFIGQVRYSPQALKPEIGQQFLKWTLPILAEAFLRRRTLRYRIPALEY